jgi:hypothetical protein
VDQDELISGIEPSDVCIAVFSHMSGLIGIDQSYGQNLIGIVAIQPNAISAWLHFFLE